MNINARVDAIADALIAAHLTGQPVDLPDRVRSDAEAYAVQDRVARGLWAANGIPIIAWKTGAPDMETTPIAAPIPASRVLSSPAALPEMPPQLIGIEVELAYTIGRDLPPRATPYGDGEIRSAVASIHPAIEICSSRLRHWRDADAPTKLADNQVNEALVVGPAFGDWQHIVPQMQTAIAEIDGVIVAKAVGGHPCGDPFPLLAWLAAHCAERCGGLRAGDVITTGAWTGMHPVAPGASVVARFPGIGEARVTLG